MSVDHERDKLTDPSDRATQAEEENLEIAMEEHARRMKRDQEPLPDGSYEHLDCDDCGDEIEGARLAVAIRNRLCIHCANARERRR